MDLVCERWKIVCIFEKTVQYWSCYFFFFDSALHSLEIGWLLDEWISIYYSCVKYRNGIFHKQMIRHQFKLMFFSTSNFKILFYFSLCLSSGLKLFSFAIWFAVCTQFVVRNHKRRGRNVRSARTMTCKHDRSIKQLF